MQGSKAQKIPPAVLAKLSDGELKKVGQTAKDKKTKEEEKIVKEIRDKYWVK